MTRAKQAELKEFKKHIGNLIKTSAKEIGYRTISQTLYKVVGDFLIDINADANDFDVLHLRTGVKPLVYDNIFWDAFQMSDNANQPVSFRAIGAFVAPVFQVSSEAVPFPAKEEVDAFCRNAVREYASKCEDYIMTVQAQPGGFDAAVVNCPNPYYRHELAKMLALINMGKYQEVLGMAQEAILRGDSGGYVNGKLTIHEAIAGYCSDRITPL